MASKQCASQEHLSEILKALKTEVAFVVLLGETFLFVRSELITPVRFIVSATRKKTTKGATDADEESNYQDAE